MTTSTAPTTTPPGDDPWAGMETQEPPQQSSERRPAVPAQRRGEPHRPKFVLRTHRPSGVTSWPLIAMTGSEYSGKSTQAARLSGSERIGTTYWLPIGEDPEPHGAVPGADYHVVEHDGSWPEIFGAAVAIGEQAEKHHAAGEPPTLVVVDSGSAEWQMHTEWAEQYARSSQAARDRLSRDPNAEIEVQRMHWNAANKRHRRLMRVLKEMPAIVVMTSRGGWVSETDPRTGQPKRDGSRVWTHQGQKDLGFESSAYIKLERDAPPEILGVRLAVGGIIPGAKGDDGQPFVFDGRKRGSRPGLPAEAFDLEWLLFKLMKFDAKRAVARRTYDPVLDDDSGEGGPVTVAAPADADEAPGKGTPDEIRPEATRGA